MPAIRDWQSVLRLAAALGETPDVLTEGGDVISCLLTWSDDNLRWLVNLLATRADDKRPPSYTVALKRARDIRDWRESEGQSVPGRDDGEGGFVLVGLDNHAFGRFRRRIDCEEFAKRMGLSLNSTLEYFGHAVIREVPTTDDKKPAKKKRK